MSVYENLKKLNIEIPKAPKPVGSYVAYKKTANLLYISGQISIDTSGKIQRENWEKNYLLSKVKLLQSYVQLI